MPVCAPHGPVHEETEFWYDTTEKALLYEVKINPTSGQAEADHTRPSERGHVRNNPPDHFHDHYQPHGINFEDATVGELKRQTNVSNTELVVRLWCQIETNEQPVKARFREPLIPVPKSLALFLAGKRSEMYKPDSLTQALILLQSHVSSQEARSVPN